MQELTLPMRGLKHGKKGYYGWKKSLKTLCFISDGGLAFSNGGL